MQCVMLTISSQVSPAKLALRRHLSQERLSSSHLASSDRSTVESRQSSSHDTRPVPSGSGLLGTRTIGDLVSGEIERTLEISNQSIINVSDMSAMIRPETVYSPISRPASAEGDAGLSTLAHVASYAPNSSGASTSTPTASSRSSVLFTPVTQPQRYLACSSQCNCYLETPFERLSANRLFTVRYTPVQLPRADIKPYHESYFSDNPSQSLASSHSATPSMHSSQSTSNGELLPVEGLAASLHARILNNHNNSGKIEPALANSRR